MAEQKEPLRHARRSLFHGFWLGLRLRQPSCESGPRAMARTARKILLASTQYRLNVADAFLDGLKPAFDFR